MKHTSRRMQGMPMVVIQVSTLSNTYTNKYKTISKLHEMSGMAQMGSLASRRYNIYPRGTVLINTHGLIEEASVDLPDISSS